MGWFGGDGALRKQVDALNDELAKVRAELSKAQAARADADKRIAEREAAVNAAKEAGRKAEKKAEGLKDARKAADDKAAATLGKVAHLERELADFRRAMLASKGEAELARARVAELEAQLAAMRKGAASAPRSEGRGEGREGRGEGRGEGREGRGEGREGRGEGREGRGEGRRDRTDAPRTDAPRTDAPRTDASGADAAGADEGAAGRAEPAEAPAARRREDDPRLDRLREQLNAEREANRQLRDRLAEVEQQARTSDKRRVADLDKNEAAVRDLQHHLRAERRAYKILQLQYEAQIERVRGAEQSVQSRVAAELATRAGSAAPAPANGSSAN